MQKLDQVTKNNPKHLLHTMWNRNNGAKHQQANKKISQRDPPAEEKCIGDVANAEQRA